MSGSSDYFTSVLIRILASESVFGYITVLPGAFSAYRYIALQNDSMGEGPLQKYFLGEKMVITISVKDNFNSCPAQHGSGADIFTANMYLAEDRVSRSSFCNAFLIKGSDSMLGACLQTWWIMDFTLCQIIVCNN